MADVTAEAAGASSAQGALSPRVSQGPCPRPEGVRGAEAAMPGGGPSERMTWPGPALPSAVPTRPFSSAAAPIPPLTRTRSLMAMSLPGSRRPSTGSRSRGLYGRNGLAVFSQCSPSSDTQLGPPPLLPASRRTSPPVSMRDTYGTSSLSSSSNSGSYKGSDSSPTPRRSMKYTLCSDNHGIKPPTPEQYLTPLQQKEVCIRHLRARLKDTQDRLQDRDSEIDDLKSQLSRMQEDWIEEECHRVEAQLALKEARKEIRQLKQVIDTVKNNLIDKDKGLQKYFVDINIQNKKLETLLHSMEVAQNGTVKEDGAGGSSGGSPARSLTRSSTYTKLSDQAPGDRNPGDLQSASTEEVGDSGFAVADDTLSRTELLEASSLLSSGVDCGPDEASLQSSFTLGSRLPTSSTYEKLLGGSGGGGVEAGVQASCMQERAIQTDFVHYQPDLDTILEKVMKAQTCGLASPGPSPAWAPGPDTEDGGAGVEMPSGFQGPMDLIPADPNSAVVVTVGEEPAAAPVTHGPSPHVPSLNPSVSIACPVDEEAGEVAAEPKSYWSRHFIVDLLAVVVPAVPTVAWLCRSQRRQGQPIYNISSLLRGCCTVALHSIRKISCRSVGTSGPVGTGGSSQL
ncbi:syntaphilin isoform X1 [Monodelphis domestica]|uniref:syntaphilin isoform X1 n=3 Tax=Monodelphis domestica TaxID=13616 RepID=UPI0024E210B9|nr:syntaphilin isoform X1 [Monodelphis domestica]